MMQAPISTRQRDEELQRIREERYEELRQVKAALGRRLYDLRIEAGLYQRDLAHPAGVERAYVSGIENGRLGPPTLTVIESFARTLSGPLRRDWREISDELCVAADRVPYDLARIFRRYPEQMHALRLKYGVTTA